MKIAKVYDLHYNNPKVAESTILYHLKRNGIRRRDAATHVRKVTKAMVDEWVRRYQAGESLKQIAEGNLSPVTVYLHLHKQGFQLRDKVEAQIKAVTKYERKPFQGDNIEKAYLMGLRYGDLNAVRHGRAIRVRVSTTHPAMADLFESVFSPYGYVHRYPREAKLVGYEWSLECDLGQSFEFLLMRATSEELETFSEQEFVGFLAGIFDAEGSFHLHRKTRWYDPEVCFSNGDSDLLESLKARLVGLGYHCSLVWRKQQQDRNGVSGGSLMGRVEILRFREAQRLARLIPIRHAEKTKRRKLLLALEFGSPSEERIETAIKWRELSQQIRLEVHSFIESAEIQLLSRGQIPVHQVESG